MTDTDDLNANAIEELIDTTIVLAEESRSPEFENWFDLARCLLEDARALINNA